MYDSEGVNPGVQDSEGANSVGLKREQIQGCRIQEGVNPEVYDSRESKSRGVGFKREQIQGCTIQERPNPGV